MGFNPSGAGGIAGASDVAFSTLQNDQVLTYDTPSAKWQNQNSSSGSTSQTGGRTLESFSGGSDDAKLGAAMAYCNAQDYPPPILLLENRVYGPFTTQRTLYSGFKLLGGPAFSNQYRGALSVPQRVDVQTSGPWLVLPSGNTFDVEIARLSFYSQSSNSEFMGNPNTGVLWTSCIRDVGFSLFKHVLGSPTNKLLLTACLFDGWWNINNSRNVSMTMGGSDNILWVGSQCLLDTPTSISSGGSVPYHLWLDYMEKTTIGQMFITGEQIPAAVRVTGSATTGGLIFSGTRMEGRNSGAPSYGSVVRVEGGHVTFRDCWISYGYANPGSSGRSNEGGVVSVLGGRVLFDACFYSRAVAETVPWLYASGGSTQIRVRNAQVAHDGGSFTGLPRVRAVNGADANVDDTVTLI